MVRPYSYGLSWEEPLHIFADQAFNIIVIIASTFHILHTRICYATNLLQYEVHLLECDMIFIQK